MRGKCRIEVQKIGCMSRGKSSACRIYEEIEYENQDILVAEQPRSLEKKKRRLK
jgi:hypothetical protein